MGPRVGVDVFGKSHPHRDSILAAIRCNDCAMPANLHLLADLTKERPVPVAAPSKAWICARSLAGIAGSNLAGGMDVLVRVVCFQVEVAATGRSLVQRIPVECVCH